jgi:hypothetical protein
MSLAVSAGPQAAIQRLGRSSDSAILSTLPRLLLAAALVLLVGLLVGPLLAALMLLVGLLAAALLLLAWAGIVRLLTRILTWIVRIGHFRIGHSGLLEVQPPAQKLNLS